MSNKEPSLSRNISRVLSTNIIVVMVGAISVFVFPKILSIESYALYHEFILYIGYISILHLGFSTGMVINYAGNNYDDINKPRYKSEIIILFSILIVFSGIFTLLSFFIDNIIIKYLAMVIFPIVLTGSYKALLQSWNKFKQFSMISFVETISIPILAISFYFLNKELLGSEYIEIYISVYWILSFWIIIQMYKKVANVKTAKILSRENLETEKLGIIFVIGNYLNVLFIAIDKQFIQWFFSVNEFAFYSFSISMQGLMTILITSISQPLFPTMAKKILTEKDYVRIKEFLFVLASLAGGAYFIIAMIVNIFIPKYIPSLNIMSIYFLMFPALAIINCIYLNFYRVYKKTKLYIVTLAVIFILSLVFNLLIVYLWKYPSGIAIATVAIYYIWMFVGGKYINLIKYNKKDLLFLSFNILSFSIFSQNESYFWEFIIYMFFIILMSIFFYKETFLYFSNRLRRI